MREGERSIVSFIPAFSEHPRLFLLFGVLYCDNGLLSSTSGKLRGMNAPLRSPGSVDLLLPPPPPPSLILRDPLCGEDFVRRSAGIDATPNTARDFRPSRVRLFRFLKGFPGFFNELILPVENIDQRNSFFLFSLFYSISNKNSKIDLRK